MKSFSGDSDDCFCCKLMLQKCLKTRDTRGHDQKSRDRKSLCSDWWVQIPETSTLSIIFRKVERSKVEGGEKSELLMSGSFSDNLKCCKLLLAGMSARDWSATGLHKKTDGLSHFRSNLRLLATDGAFVPVPAGAEVLLLGSQDLLQGANVGSAREGGGQRRWWRSDIERRVRQDVGKSERHRLGWGWGGEGDDNSVLQTHTHIYMFILYFLYLYIFIYTSLSKHVFKQACSKSGPGAKAVLDTVFFRAVGLKIKFHQTSYELWSIYTCLRIVLATFHIVCVPLTKPSLIIYYFSGLLLFF